MIPKQIWTYWEGERPPYIQHCLNTILKRAGVKVNLVTPRNLSEYIEPGEILHKNCSRIMWIAQKVDCIRIALLYKYGGIWCDADTVFLKSAEHLFDSEYDFTGIKWKRTGRILNGYFMAQKGSKFLAQCVEYINRIVTTNFKTNYKEHGGVLFGECMFQEVWAKNRNLVKFWDLEIFLPIEFPFAKGIWYQRKNVRAFLTSNTIAVGLNHSQYPDTFRNRSLDSHKAEDTLFGTIFKYSDTLDYAAELKDVICPKCGHSFQN